MSVPTAAPSQRHAAGSNLSISISPSASSTMLSTASTPASALYNFRLLEALRSDDPGKVQPFLDELRPSTMSANGMQDEMKAGKLLGMAVKVASVPIVSQIITSSGVSSPNLPVAPGSLTTALHVASENGRSDVVEFLLNHPRISDTIRDEQGRTALECAANHEVASAIEESRGTLQVRYIAQLSSYVGSPLSSVEESMAMVEFLEGPRTEILNLNALDERSGTGLLHEAARRRDMRLVEVAVRRGADVFVRDKKGRRVLEGEKGADERIKAFLRQFNNQDNSIQPKSDGRPPDLHGFLSKWVNYRSGWRTRWFVLQNGVLSYYRNREDEDVACRGSIAMAVATLHPSNDSSRFEVHSKASSSVPKFIVKSAHREEIARWIQTLKLNIEYYSEGGNPAPPAMDTEAARSRRPASLKLSPLTDKPPPSSATTLSFTENFLSPKLARSLSGISLPSRLSGNKRRDPSPTGTADGMTDGGDTISLFEATEKDSIIGNGGPRVGTHGIPHDPAYDLGVLNMKAQVELTQQLIDSISSSPSSRSANRGGQQLEDMVPRQQAVTDALHSSLATLATLISQQHIMSQDRERYLMGRIHREVEARKLWEENMMAIAQQQADMDRQLSEAARDNEKKRRALRQARGYIAGLGEGSVPLSPMSPARAEVGSSPTSTGPGILDVTLGANGPKMSTPLPASRSADFRRGSVSNAQEVRAAIAAAGGGSDSENEDDDEFFDAIEQNTLPNLKQHQSIAQPERSRPVIPIQEAKVDEQVIVEPVTRVGVKQPERGTIKDLLARNSLEPYSHVRSKLPIDDDKRPSVSLWSILKSSVGKDLTKISFPVSFNECTSMLQRMAEDMEYDACLTVAAGEEDSLKRIAFVGAFAMSNYSSTIGRVAKPFNPLLSQSYEYAIPNRYRYISEQVSHHPPISTCYCEAPTWKYFGEVDAQNKFQGRSFEIRPTGVAHATLVIPKAWVRSGLQYPAAGAEYGDGRVLEHYSWKKVTTNVSNFIMGSPIIDHYGDLIVTNHRTGETCTLTFKPRTWRGKDAFEIKGNVTDSSGRVAWDLAGRWDSQLIARHHASSAPLDVDTEFKPSQKEYLQLWRNSEKPKAPFNLTPFAVTLNDIPQGLQPYICPTDCRMRTDQRAFENAEYDRAQELKSANEELQRSTRKARAEGRLPPHEPRWFTSSTEPDSGERVWEPKRTESGEVLFWAEREKAAQSGHWEGVEPIFAQD